MSSFRIFGLVACASVLAWGHAASVRAQDDAPAHDADTVTPAPAPAPAAEPPPAPAPEPAPPPPASDNAPPPPPPPANDGDYGGRSDAPPPQGRERNYDNEYEAEPDESPSDTGPHEFSVRLDPLHWLLDGRLGIELEYGIWKFISIEMVPVFVTNDNPPTINLSGLEDTITQHSNGLGPIAGASLGAGFWLGGEPFSGYVLRAYFTNYAYTYKAGDGAGTFDKVNTVERRFVGFFGSHSRFGPFTLAGGFGIGYELNQAERCGLTTPDPTSDEIDGRTVHCSGHRLIAAERPDATGHVATVQDVNGSMHPISLEFRFSLGFVF